MCIPSITIIGLIAAHEINSGVQNNIMVGYRHEVLFILIMEFK